LVTLDYVAHLVFAEIAQLDAAFQTRADFFDVILETSQRRKAAIVNRLALRRSDCAGGYRGGLVSLA